MASGATPAETAKVMFVLVASSATSGHVLKGPRLVTGLAFDLGMSSNQRKFRKIMIKQYILPPFGFVVAAFAAVTELPLMGILLFVAGNAAGTQFNFIKVTFMAALTFDLLMRAAQRELGVFTVVKV